MGSNITVGSFIFISSRIMLTCNKDLPVKIGFTSAEKSSTDLKQHYLTSQNALNKDKIVVSVGAGVNKFNNDGSNTGAGSLNLFTGNGIQKPINGAIRVYIDGFVINDVLLTTNTKITPDNYIGNMTIAIEY